MKIQIICSLLGLLCGDPAQTQETDGTFYNNETTDTTFETYNDEPCDHYGSMSTERYEYKAVDAGSGRCKWVIDEDAMKSMMDMETHRQELWWALRSRPLTDAEMAEVAQMGISLTVRSMESYKEEEKMRELNDALLQQYRLRAAAQK